MKCLLLHPTPSVAGNALVSGHVRCIGKSGLLFYRPQIYKQGETYNMLTIQLIS